MSAGEDALKRLDSSMKRNAALMRKLRALGEDSRQGVLDDIAKTNQSKVSVRGVGRPSRECPGGWGGERKNTWTVTFLQSERCLLAIHPTTFLPAPCPPACRR